MRTALALVIVFVAAPALAQEDDGVYRRWDSDASLALGIGGGVVLASDATDGDPAGSLLVEARLRIIDVAGPVVAYRWSGDAGGHLMLGIELRPLWPALFLIDKPTRVEWLDLFLQSIGVEVGAVILPLGDPEGAPVDRGVALAVGVAVEVPLVIPSRLSGAARGIFLRLAARRVDATRRFRGTADDVDLSEWSLNATLQVALGLGVGADREPARYRTAR